MRVQLTSRKCLSPLFAVALFVCVTSEISAQANLFNHLFWSAKGNHQGQALGGSGLNYLGTLNGSIKHAVALGSDGGASLIHNIGKQDTTRHFKFPGEHVFRANFNGDAYPDYAVWSKNQKRITILYGTENVDSFITERVLQGKGVLFANLEQKLAVADCDSDGYDDLVVSDGEGQNDNGHVGRILFFRGGEVFDSLAADSLYGQSKYDPVGAELSIAHVRDKTHWFLCEHRPYGNSVQGVYYRQRVFLYPLGPNFHLQSVDTILCSYDSLKFGELEGGGFAFDADGDSIDDIILTAGLRVMVYKGGAQVDSQPTYYFKRPFNTGSIWFGSHILALGDVSKHGYSSILVTDQEAGSGGAAYIYNIGKGLKDSCVAYAFGPQNSFGQYAIGIGDVNGDGLQDMMIGANADSVKGADDMVGVGEVFVFLGDASYGADISTVLEHDPIPTGFSLEQNYPNPFSSSTELTFSVDTVSVEGSSTVVTLHDLLGREVKRVFEEQSARGRYTIRFSGSDLPSGSYVCRLRCGEKEIARKVDVLH